MVLDAIRVLEGHPTADEIYAKIYLAYPDISKATIYRNLNTMVEHGDLQRILIPDGADKYDYFVHKHYHVECAICGDFINLENIDYLPSLDEEAEKFTGYKGLKHDIIFTGICPRCQNKVNGVVKE